MTKIPKTKRKKRKRLKQLQPPPQTSLRFSPTAWAKLLFLRDLGETEVGGFGISASSDLLRVEDVQLVKQSCSWAHVAFEDESVANFFDQQVDLGKQPQEFGRIWVHTHPGDSAQPSATDEETFSRVFGSSDWAIMFILAQCGQTYARLRFNVGPQADFEIPVSIDYSQPFAGCDLEAWGQEYLQNVRPEEMLLGPHSLRLGLESGFHEQGPVQFFDSWLEEEEEEDLVRMLP